MGVVLGIDVSTTATKAIVIDGSGRVLGMASSEYPFEQPHPLWSEQHPHLWWPGTTDAIARALVAAGVTGDDVAAVGLTGQMHGLVLLDADGESSGPRSCGTTSGPPPSATRSGRRSARRASSRSPATMR